jgi:hypothetical protein
MEAKTIQERIRTKLTEAGAVWDFDPALIDFVVAKAAVEFGNDLAYDPATHVVVSRETAEIGGNACLWLSQDIDLPMEHRMDFHAADMDFRAAMEVGE